ncbi:patatin-like phospholipase family protein [Stieleria sp. TO1_6]|uniref:patatin-like phospholipase family protein n=1 Tax=Stieleria tagensis TaxID=2956795 RepID=UPI00209AA77F|nr:patatin-like phospholipase family protein [Stieleria tagensis]MCO8122386.1 patatin-like phospholipase family protein [Stieleria tagensis]
MNTNASDRRFGLALSGGGFRAALYHLGVIRFLRDANTLANVTDITSVSGGSVIGAHLVLNWDRYCGSDEEFDQVSGELLAFLQLDVRNRIVRRFPLASMVNTTRRALRLSTRRQLTRAGLLEQHYENFLYGDTGLFNLPESPRLYILATNLSEGSLCAFYREGLLLQRRSRCGKQVHFEEVEMGLATVPMAVAASSAFPGFFPPLELCGRDVGAKSGEFDRHSFTDGGIYDNIGLRMFHHLQQNAPRRAEADATVDVLDQEAFAESVMSGASMPAGSAQRELTDRILRNSARSSDQSVRVDGAQQINSLLVGLSEVSRTEELYRIPAFQSLPLSDQQAQAKLHRIVSSGQEPDIGDRIWLNCELASAALRHIGGRPCIKSGPNQLDGVLVSDAGASFKIRSGGRAGGLLSTALRSTDILMDRVNQLETESFADTAGALFFPITRQVRQNQDPTAPHPEIQRQAALIRTDMDKFSDLEISSLVQHGYCVARQVFRESGTKLSDNVPDNAPWDPLGNRYDLGGAAQSLSEHQQVLPAARKLQRSSSRRTVSTLFDFHDWPTYLWIPLLAFVTLTLPYVMYTAHRTSVRQGYVLTAVAETSPIYRDVLDLLHNGRKPAMPVIPFEEVDSVKPLDFTGYDVITDDRIYDLRGWTEHEQIEHPARMHARFRFRRTPEALDRSHLRIQLPTSDPSMRVEFLPKNLQPTHTRLKLGPEQYLFETALDFSHVPIGTDTSLMVNQVLSDTMADQKNGIAKFRFTIAAKTGLARIWVLLPEGRDHDQFALNRYPIDHPEQVELVQATMTVELPIGSIATFELINPESDYRYECRWRWLDMDNSHSSH